MKIGIIGAGQLAQMLAQAAVSLGIKVKCIAESMHDCAEPVADLFVIDHQDEESLQAFADSVDIITYENENISMGTIEFLSQFCPIYPPIAALNTVQDRLYEKRLFREMDIITPDFMPVNTRDDLLNAANKIGMPLVLKTRRYGYDGKRQTVIRDKNDIDEAWRTYGNTPCIVEQFVQFDYEVSMIAVRNGRGDFAFYPLTLNQHRNGILRESSAPVENTDLERQAQMYAKVILDHFNYVGVMTIEFFVKNDHLIANEIAPRVHNSGHWTIEGAQCSQFENHVRSICNYTLGSTFTAKPCRMLNIIGEQPKLDSLLSHRSAHVHLYGKEPRAGRKLGHITIIESQAVSSFDEAAEAIHDTLNEKVNA